MRNKRVTGLVFVCRGNKGDTGGGPRLADSRQSVVDSEEPWYYHVGVYPRFFVEECAS